MSWKRKKKIMLVIQFLSLSIMYKDDTYTNLDHDMNATQI